MMQFKHTHSDHMGNIVSEVTHKIYADDSIHEVMQAIRFFLLAVSFSTGTVDKYIEAD